MTDVMEEDLGSEDLAVPVTIDHIVPDDLEVGTYIIFEGRPYSFLHKEEGRAPLIFKSETGPPRLIELLPTEYIQRFALGEIRKLGKNTLHEINSETESCSHDDKFEALPKKARHIAEMKELYVEEFARRIQEAEERGEKFARNETNASIVREFVDAALPKDVHPLVMRSARSILRWLQRSELKKGSPMANVHGNYQRPYNRKISQRVLDVIAAVIREQAGTLPHALRPSTVRRLVNAKIREINLLEGIHLPPVKITTVTSEFNRYDGWVRLAATKGKHAADLEFGAVGKLVRPTRINQLWELDNHSIDLIPILGSTDLGQLLSKSALGRLDITLAIDVYSGYPVGFYPSFEGTGLLPSLMCIAHGIQEKTYVAQRFPHICGSLLAHGKPTKIRFDRAPEYVGRQMARSLRRVGIGFELARPRFPDDKPYIERFFGTLEKDFVSWLKGRTGSNPRDRGVANPAKEAAIELDDFVALLHEYFITVYARRPQRGLDWDTPEQRWLRGLQNYKPRLLTRDEQARVDVLASIEVKVNAGREGIQWRNKHYQSPELQSIRRTSGNFGTRKNSMTPLVGRISLRDVGVMFVSVPGAEPPSEIAVPCATPAAHGRTVWQDEVVQALLRQKKKNPQSKIDYEDGFSALFRRSIGYMGIETGLASKSGSSRGAVTAARFTGAMVDGVSKHALTRVVRDGTALDLFDHLMAQNKDQAVVEEDISAIDANDDETLENHGDVPADDIDMSDFLGEED
jgi:transposase InsO family protein